MVGLVEGETQTRKRKALLGGDSDKHLTPLEKFQIGFVQRSFEPGPADKTIRVLQRVIGSTWIDVCSRRVRHIIGRDRLPELTSDDSFVLVSNHRSFFDLYVVFGYLVKHGLAQRIVFPVRSKFFYDHPLGMIVNGAMSFFAMYPPVFRERERAALNIATLDEVVRLLERGGTAVGLHPEGQRNKSGDPYALLPAQSGVGRIIHGAKVKVVPIFINGLINNIGKQVVGNLTGSADPIIIAFGKPVDFDGLLDEPPSPRVFKRLSERCMEEVAKLGEEEKAYRTSL